MKSYDSVDAYIANFPPQTQEILLKIRKIVHKQTQDAGERISYGIPTFTINGKYFIYMAAYPKHVSIYPLRAGSTLFDKELKPYHSGTATIKFPLNKPIPWELVRKIIDFKAKSTPV
jgi:uncharacterized protein YdhG (YjbR/CyaY superfamily)